jgi:hypothetical protein
LTIYTLSLYYFSKLIQELYYILIPLNDKAIGAYNIETLGIEVLFIFPFTVLMTFIVILLFTQLDPLIYAQVDSAVVSSAPSSSALTASFPRQEVNTGKYDGIQIFRNPSAAEDSTYVQSTPNYTNLLDNATDIQMITYYSIDGRILNATLWLGGQVEPDPGKYGADTVVYGVLVDSDNNEDTGKYGVDFQKEIQWNSKLRSWNTLFFEYSSSEHLRTLEVKSNSTNFFDQGQKYVIIPLEMESITFPGHFRVLYYAIVIYSDTDTDTDTKRNVNSHFNQDSLNQNTSRILVDLSSWIDIPPPTYSFSTTPSPLEIVQGEEQEIGIQLISSSGMLPDSVSFVPTEDSVSGVTIEQTNTETKNETSSGISPTSFRIRVPNEANIGLHTIPILVNVSTGSLFPSGFVELPGINLSLPAENFASRYVNLTFSVMETPSVTQTIKDFWVTYGTPIAILAGGVVGAFSTFFIDHLRNRREHK